jgi:hypothetical protein
LHPRSFAIKMSASLSRKNSQHFEATEALSIMGFALVIGQLLSRLGLHVRVDRIGSFKVGGLEPQGLPDVLRIRAELSCHVFKVWFPDVCDITAVCVFKSQNGSLLFHSR